MPTANVTSFWWQRAAVSKSSSTTGTTSGPSPLTRPYYGLHIPPGIWAAEQGFSSGSICLVLTSHIYDEADYIRDYASFIDYIRHGSK